MCSINKDKLNDLLDYVRGDYNLFHVLNIDHKENFHSRMIADLLDPKGAHLLGDMPLQKFCEIAYTTPTNEQLKFKAKNLKSINTDKLYVKCEKVTDSSRRMDIYIIDRKGQVVIIENKIGAKDQDSQLFDYYQYGLEQVKTHSQDLQSAQNTNNLHLFYLTLNGEEPSDHSITRNGNKLKDYIKISYKQHILPWLESIIASSQVCIEKPLLFSTLLQYKDIIKSLINPDMLICKISAAIPDKLNIKCNTDSIIQYITKQLRNKIAERLYKEITGSQTFELRYFDENQDNYVKIDEHTNIKIWNTGFYFAFAELKTEDPKIKKLNNINVGIKQHSTNRYMNRTVNYHYFWTLSTILSDNTLLNINMPGKLTPNDLEFLLSDKEVFSNNFEQIINTLNKYIDIVKTDQVEQL